MSELMFKSKKITPKLNTYVITVTGRYKDYQPCETNIINVEADRMNNFVLLFLAYVGNRNWQHKWKNSTFGENFKKGPLQTYLGAFTTDTHYPCMKLMWNDVISVNISYIDNNGTYILCELPDVEEMYDTEEDFLTELKLQFDEFNKNDPRDVYEDEGIEIVDSYELELVRNVLRSTGKWDNDEIDNLFWVNHDIGFHSLIKRDSVEDSLLKVCNQEHAKSATGVEYNGFKPETLEKIKVAIEGTTLPEETKTFLIDICSKYNSKNMLSESEKKDLKTVIETYNLTNALWGWIGPDGWSGIYLEHVINPEMIDFDDYSENSVIKYEGETYIIHEGD